MIAASPIDKTLWQGENMVRKSGEWVELQFNRLLDFLEGQESPELSSAWDWGQFCRVVSEGAVALALGILLLYGLLRQLQQIWKTYLRSRLRAADPLQQSLETDLQTVEDWLAQAAQAQSQENYQLGCRALYMALLLRLEQTGWLRRDRTSTDQEYLQQLESAWILQAKPIGLQQTWRRIFQVHEWSYYGSAPVAGDMFEQCQQAYQTLDPQLSTSPEAKMP
ncbi:MAG: DUF4129 domain-containing protein [Acaryochloridaceae cyanobacterium SU_2_1]|nr:DUF4129 domain-containing protein [Acaryochloridaceae cyanobacterium SU_2_1]